jgi:transposase InsO family protein
MSRARVAVLQVISKQLSVTEAAAQYGYSRQHLHRLVARYREGGLDAVEPRSRKPLSSPQATEGKVREFIVRARLELTAAGWDAGPVTIAWHLEQAGLHVPSTSTIRRVLHAAGLVTPEPRKRPRSSYKRFEAAQPNECWQSDFTHWALDGGADAEIINWLDDHSRYLLGCSAHAPVTGKVVVDTFLQASNTHGLPAATLTDNGRVYTARFGGGRNAFEYLLAALGITQKNGHPFHPQTQGKVERFHQTQKLWLAAQPPAATLAVLQAQLDVFRGHYNEDRPNRAVQRQTPGQAYRARPKAWPASAPSGYYRLRYDHVDKGGKVSIRRAGRMHHLGIGIAHTGKEILAITDTATATVIELRTGEVLSVHDIDPARSYWRNKQTSPGRWPGLSVT